MNDRSFINMCIFNVHDGLREGLSHFSQQSRAALIYAIHTMDPLYIYDPQNLLRGHEPKLKEVLLDSQSWRTQSTYIKQLKFMEHVDLEELRLDLSGLITYGSRSNSVYFQMWFTEHHPDLCSVGPTERWLEYSASLLSQNLSTGNVSSIGTTGYVLQECATHAVRDHIVDRRNVMLGWDTRLRIFPILDSILGISRTVEEGKWPRGQLVFIEPAHLDNIHYLAMFPLLERPSLVNFKHVRKLLQAVEDSDRKLVSDGKSIIGITTDDELADDSIIAEFHGVFGWLRLGDEPVCSFSDGSFHSSTRKANLVTLEEALLETDLDPTTRHDLFIIVTRIVQNADQHEHGCTLVIDLYEDPVEISGQTLEQPLDLRHDHLLELAQALAKVDGAIHIRADLKLHGFACLLDGHAVPGENRARGARFNSALRFSSEHPGLMVVVVSSDKPVSVIQGGVELTAQCEISPVSSCLVLPPTLEDWIHG